MTITLYPLLTYHRQTTNGGPKASLWGIQGDRSYCREAYCDLRRGRNLEYRGELLNEISLEEVKESGRCLLGGLGAHRKSGGETELALCGKDSSSLESVGEVGWGHEGRRRL